MNGKELDRSCFFLHKHILFIFVAKQEYVSGPLGGVGGL
jgi:hypothetical protein